MEGENIASFILVDFVWKWREKRESDYMTLDEWSQFDFWIAVL